MPCEEVPFKHLEGSSVYIWKRLKGKNPEGKNFRKHLRRKLWSAKISKIARNTLKSSQSDIFDLLRNLLKYLLRFFFREIFRSFRPLHFDPLALSNVWFPLSVFPLEPAIWHTPNLFFWPGEALGSLSWRTDAAFLLTIWKLPAYSGAFVLTIDNFSFFTYNWSFFTNNNSVLLTNGAFCLQWKVRLISAFWDCKQRNLTVSKTTPTVSEKLPKGPGRIKNTMTY